MGPRKSSYNLLLVIFIVFNAVDRIHGSENQADREGVTLVTTSIPNIRPGIDESEGDIRTGMSILEGTECGKNSFYNSFGVHAGQVYLFEYPWMALLVYSDGIERTLDCGGTLIHERYVLTAAYCIFARNKTLVSVRLGEYDIATYEDCTGTGEFKKCAPPRQEIDVEEAIYHKDYNPSVKYYDDIGLVRLVRNAELVSNVKPICLPLTPSSKEVSVNHRMIMTGWGRVERSSKYNVMQRTVMELRIFNYCLQMHKLPTNTKRLLCAAGFGVFETCKGDIGGPIFYPAVYKTDMRYIQYALVLAGSTLCGSMYPGIYIQVDSYLPWIASNMRLN